MQFNLTTLDYTQEITAQLKNQYDAQIETMAKTGKTDEKGNRMVTLFHGTSLYHLNSILLNGLLPRRKSNLSNYDEELESNPYLVYLTNKWHYFYANAACNTLIKAGTPLGQEWNIPAYVEFKLPLEYLTLDEDFFHSKYVKDKLKSCLKKQKPFLELTLEECLAQYATAAHLGEILPSSIVSFTILTDMDCLRKNFLTTSQYQKEFIKWGQGKGKGSLKFIDLVQLEDSPYNLTFFMKDVPQNSIISEFIFKESENKYALKMVQAEIQTKGEVSHVH